MPENLNLADSIVSMLECLAIWTVTLVEVATDMFLGGLASLAPTRTIPEMRKHFEELISSQKRDRPILF
jgi:hypothetical protein